MATTVPGNTYAQIVNGRVHATFLGSTLPQYNASQITLVDVTGNVPTVGQVYANNVFSNYVPTQEETDAATKASEAASNKNDVFNDANVLAFVERTPAQVVSDINALADVAAIKAYLRNPILALHYMLQSGPLDKT